MDEDEEALSRGRVADDSVTTAAEAAVAEVGRTSACLLLLLHSFLHDETDETEDDEEEDEDE